MLTANLYKDFNLKLIKLINKRPPKKSTWQKLIEDFGKTNYKSFGFVLENHHLIVDVDVKNNKKGLESFEKLCKDLDLNLDKTVITPSSGFHIYLTKNPEIKIKKNLGNYPDIDFLSSGCYVVCAGSEIEEGSYKFADTTKNLFFQQAPTNLEKLLSKTEIIQQNNPHPLLTLPNPTNTSEEEITQALEYISPDLTNNEWVKIGMALKSWNPEKGFKIWENWSKNGKTWQEGETYKRWQSFKDTKSSPISIATLFYYAKQQKEKDDYNKFDSITSWLKTATKKELTQDLQSKINNLTLSTIQKEILAKSLQKRHQELLDIKLPIKEMRNLISKPHSEPNKPSWCLDWVYLIEQQTYYNLKKTQQYTIDAFNLENGIYIPANDTGSKQSAHKFCCDNGYIEMIDTCMYLPQYTENKLTVDNKKVINTYNPDSSPSEAEKYTKEGLEFIELFKKHTLLICNNNKINADILTQYLAHNIQFKGKKILWTPLIYGKQGIGKSFYGNLLALMLGDQNVGKVSSEQAVSQFNGWATGKCVNILEELRIKGKNRHEIVNSIKPLITDSTIQIRHMYKNAYSTLNVTNYICFTNFKDAVPVDKNDRRWFIIYNNIEKLEDIEKLTGFDKDKYFPMLFDSLRKNYKELKKWMLEYNISDEFKNMMQAPKTDYKALAIATEEADIEYLAEVKEIIEEGGEYFNINCISSSDLFDHACFKIPNISTLTPRKKNFLLKKLGYSQLPTPISLGGKTRRIWAKNMLNKEQIKNFLKPLT